MTLEPLVSVLITNYNGLKHINDCLDSLNCLNINNFEIIFVDNNSQDKSVEYVKINYPDVRIIQNHKDLGFAGANNVGVSQARGKYITLLNIDTRVDKNWLTELVNVVESSENIGIVASKIYYYYDKSIIDFAGSSCDKYGNTYHIGITLQDNKMLNMQKKTFYACGASLLIKKSLCDKIGLFDPTYFAYFEDVDLCWRAWISGYDVIYAPRSFIYHKVGGINKDEKRKIELSDRNRLRTLLKNYQLITLIRVILGYYRGVFNRLLFLLENYRRQLAAQFALSTFKALSWNLFHIKSLILQRRIISKYRKRSDKSIMKLMKEFENYRKLIK